MLSKSQIEQLLSDNLPATQKEEVLALASVIFDMLKNPGSSNIVPSQGMRATLTELAGKEINTNDSIISFGSGSQIGDITVRDIAGRDIVNIHLHFRDFPVQSPMRQIITTERKFGCFGYTLFQTVEIITKTLEAIFPVIAVTVILSALGLMAYTGAFHRFLPMPDFEVVEPPIYDENFSVVDENLVVDNGEWRQGYRGDALFIHVSAPDASRAWAPGNVPVSDNKYVIEVDVTLLDGRGGLMLESATFSERLLFLIDKESRQYVIRREEGAEGALSNGELSENLLSIEDVNKMKVVLMGEHGRFFLNGVIVSDFTVPNTVYSRYGLVAEKNVPEGVAEAVFDNLTISVVREK